MKHFIEYFNQLLNQPVVKGDNEINFHCTVESKIEKPQREEINNLKNNKAPGENNIVAELLKKGVTEIRKINKKMISII